jgi:hypothetical protein
VIVFSCSPTVAWIAMMKSRPGNTMIISVRRETTVSTQPRKYPAARPITTPIITEKSVASTATSSEVWAP